MKFIRTICLLLALACCTSLTAGAAEPGTGSGFLLNEESFACTSADEGVYFSAVPAVSKAQVTYGSRVLRAGDLLPVSALDCLMVQSRCLTPQEVSISYHTVSDHRFSPAQELRFSILPQKNQSPIAQDSDFETYKNMENSGTLLASDPDGDFLTYALEEEPKRGTVSLKEDGTFTYTPNKNSVGKDSFTFVVRDPAGNTSEPAKVTIHIRKPSDRRVYADMQEDPDAFYAAWMREEGLFHGTSVAGNLCFGPDTPVTRGEFLVMAMQLTDAEASETGLTSGFADEQNTPVWLQKYIASALRCGMISGVHSDAGLVFQPEGRLTKAEAAVLMQNILQLPVSTAKPVFAPAEESLPVWAEESVEALAASGISLAHMSSNDAMTRREAARLFYQVHRLLETEAAPTFFWVR